MTLKKRTWKDRIRAMYKAQDEVGLEEELERADQEMKEEETSGSMPAIHLHLPSGSVAAAPEEKTTVDESETPAQQGAGDPIAELRSMVQALAEEVSKMKKAETAEAEQTLSNDEEACDPEKDKMTTDSASLTAEFRDVLSKAEILSPGIKVPTLDAKATVKSTRDAMCSLRRQAVTGAMSGPRGETIKKIVGGRDVGKITCDSLEVLFDAAAEVARQQTNDSLTRVDPGDLAQANRAVQSTVADINKRNREYWGSK